VTWTYRWATAIWLLLIATSTAGLSYTLVGRPLVAKPEHGASNRDRDDADAVLAAFGAAEEDRTTGVDSGDAERATRSMTYRSRRVRVMFLLRLRGSPPRGVWKLAGFVDLDGRRALSGEEALRRLLSR
jgi:hypothetical protein